jgi:diacylglycerol kinase (ATP)
MPSSLAIRIRMRITLLHNPESGEELDAAQLTARLEEAGHHTVYVSTKERKRLHSALQDPGDLVVAAGGDGTVKAVARAIAGCGVPMAILPFGTANNIAKSLGVLGPTRELIAGWQTARPRRVDVGLARAPWGERRFVESVGGGVFARLIARGRSEVDENPLELTGNEIDRALQLLDRILESYRPHRWRMALDGVDLSGDYLLVEAMNVRFIGPNIPLSPDADPSDGLLDVVTVGEQHRATLRAYVAGRLQGSALAPRFPVHRGSQLHVTRPHPELHIDDDIWPEEGGSAEHAQDERSDEARDVRAARLGPIDVTLERGALVVLVGAAPAG